MLEGDLWNLAVSIALLWTACRYAVLLLKVAWQNITFTHPAKQIDALKIIAVLLSDNAVIRFFYFLLSHYAGISFFLVAIVSPINFSHCILNSKKIYNMLLYKIVWLSILFLACQFIWLYAHWGNIKYTANLK